MRKAIAIVLAAATVTASFGAFAQAGDANPSAQCRGQSNSGAGPRDQQFCFSDTDVSGIRPGAEGANVRVGPRFHGPSLIQHRAHFVPQMLHSVENF